MFGKLFQCCYTGSMVGSGPVLFAVWPYIIAHAYRGTVELNPAFISLVLGCKKEEVEAAIERLCEPDPQSRSKAEEGRRMVKIGDGPMYRVVNHEHYLTMRTPDDRREYMRQKKAESRARAAASEMSTDVNPVCQQCQPTADSRQQTADGRISERERVERESQLPLSATSAPSGARRSASKDRGTRLPDDWTLPAEWGAWAVKELSWPRSRVKDTAERFRNYWLAAPGAKGRKARWDLTWRNWCLRENDNNPERSGADYHKVIS